MQQLARAEHALESDPSRALSLARAGDARFPDGYFHQERTYVAIIALTKLGRAEEASALARRFFASYPASPYRQRLERALSSRETR
jgi:outer membrane protein assembly factor BamD (BamD/ComL family)